MPSAFLAAARRPAVARDLEALAAELSRDIAARGPACWASGRCCNFDAHGHRLYTTALEAAYTLTRLRQQASPAPDGASSPKGEVPRTQSAAVGATPPSTPPLSTDPWHARPARAPQPAAPDASHDVTVSPSSPEGEVSRTQSAAVGATSSTPPTPFSSSVTPATPRLELPQLASTPPSPSPSPNARCPIPDASAIASARARGGCPFQSANLCSIHDLKPLACRVYFCDRTADAWMTDTAERFHDRVRALHDRHNIPYLYAEWRDLLEVLIAAE